MLRSGIGTFGTCRLTLTMSVHKGIPGVANPRASIVAHEVTNSGSDRAQLANMAKQAKAVLKTETLDAVADRG